MQSGLFPPRTSRILAAGAPMTPTDISVDREMAQRVDRQSTNPHGAQGFGMGTAPVEHSYKFPSKLSMLLQVVLAFVHWWTRIKQSCLSCRTRASLICTSPCPSASESLSGHTDSQCSLSCPVRVLLPVTTIIELSLVTPAASLKQFCWWPTGALSPMTSLLPYQSTFIHNPQQSAVASGLGTHWCSPRIASFQPQGDKAVGLVPAPPC